MWFYKVGTILIFMTWHIGCRLLVPQRSGCIIKLQQDAQGHCPCSSKSHVTNLVTSGTRNMHDTWCKGWCKMFKAKTFCHAHEGYHSTCISSPLSDMVQAWSSQHQTLLANSSPGLIANPVCVIITMSYNWQSRGVGRGATICNAHATALWAMWYHQLAKQRGGATSCSTHMMMRIMPW